MGKCKAQYLRGHKIEIFPTEDQKIKIQECIDITRAVYNIGLDYQINNRDIDHKKYIKYFEMCKIFKDMRNNNPEYSWFNKITMSTIRQALYNLNNAFQEFFNKINKFPRFKSKKTTKKSFTVRSDRVEVKDDQYIRIPELGITYCKNHQIPIGTRMYDTVITYDGYGRYYLSFVDEVEMVDMSNKEKTDTVGIDVGIRNMITTSDGHYYHFSNCKRFEKRLKRQDRRLQKHYKHYLNESLRTKTKYDDIPKSKNMQKLLGKQYKTYQKIHNKRMNDIHNATKEIVERNPEYIVIEDIRVRDMMFSNKWFKKYSPLAMFYEIHRQLQYKAEDRGIQIIKADPHFPSSKMCSNCGHIKNIHGAHTYKCPVCGLIMDRDLNAAINLRNLVYQ